MGASPTIEQQAAKDKAFQQYIDEQNKVLDATTTTAKKEMQSQIEAFYQAGGWNDAKPMASGAYQHLATASEWSLSHVTDMIDSVRDALFGAGPVEKTVPAGSNVPVPESAKGSTIAPPDAQTQSLLDMATGTERIIANAAFQMISGILAAFKSSTETSLAKNVAQKEVIPGLSLFICVMENKYHRSDFLTNEIIVQNFYIYEARMSVSRGADIAKFDRLGNLISQQKSLQDQATEFSTAIKNLKLADYKSKHGGDLQAAVKDYKADLGALKEMLTEVNNSIDETLDHINALRKAKAKADTALLMAKSRELARL